MIRNLIASDKPVCDKCKVGVVDLSEVGHFWRASIRVLSLCEEVVDCANRVRLHGIITTVVITGTQREIDEVRNHVTKNKQIKKNQSDRVTQKKV